MVWTHDAPFFYVSHADGTKDIVGEIGIKKMLGLTPLYRPIDILDPVTQTVHTAPLGAT